MMMLAGEPQRAHRFLDKLVEIHLANLERFLGAVGEHIDIILFGDDLGMQIDDRSTVLNSKRRYVGEVTLANQHIVRSGADKKYRNVRKQLFKLELKSQVFGGEALLHCVSPVGKIDLENQEKLDNLYCMQQKTNMSKVCAVYSPKDRKHMVTVEGDRLFNIATTQWQEIDDLITMTVEAADKIECELLQRDEDAQYCKIMQEG